MSLSVSTFNETAALLYSRYVVHIFALTWYKFHLDLEPAIFKLSIQPCVCFLNKDEICRSSRDKKKKLGQAFDVIKIIHNGEDMVTYRTWKRLMNLAKPNLSKNQIDLLMLILDMNRSGHIGKFSFQLFLFT